MHVDAVHENPLPNKMPAFGLAAVPSPTKNRNTAPGYQPATGDPTAAPSDTTGAVGSPLDTCAAGATVRDRAPNSRRLPAATVHANDAAPGPSPEPPRANHATTSSPTPRTPPAAAARGVALITGADSTGGATSTTATPDEPTSDRSTSGPTESTAESDKSDSDESDGDRSTESEFTPAALPTPDTTEPGRG